MDNEIESYFEKPIRKRYVIEEWQTWETLEEVDKIMSSFHPEWIKIDWRRVLHRTRHVRR